MLITSFFWVPILRMIPISLIRSLTDIIMILKIETPATIIEIPPIAVTNVVIVPNVAKIVARVALLSMTETILSLLFICFSIVVLTSAVSCPLFTLTTT